MSDNRQLLKITHITPVNEQTSCFRLEAAEKDINLVGFLPGQYINLFYEIGETKTSRPYSIASSPMDAGNGFYEIFIHSGGEFTAPWLFQNCRVGSLIHASYPTGDFHYNPQRDTQNVIAISGGMSVTPLRSMVRAVFDKTLDIDLTLFCGWDYFADALFMEEFRTYAEQCDRFNVVFIFAEENVPHSEHGFVTLETIHRYANPKNATYFMCGPKEMYDLLDREIGSLEIPPSNYHREVPGEAKWSEVGVGYPGGERENLNLTVSAGSNIRHIPMHSQETILVAMERAGISTDARCRSGACEFCQSRLESGNIYVPERWENRTQDERASSLIHPCCSFPLSDIHISIKIVMDRLE